MQYGFLYPQRRDELRSVGNAASTDDRMRKIYAVLHLLGFASIEGLDARDMATLTLVEKYVKFKQGEAWADIDARFHAKGFRPTGADRARLQSGLDFSEHLANLVVQDQRRLLAEAAAAEAAAERQAYADHVAQARLEHDIKFYKKDKSLVSAKEKAEARRARDAMLAASGAETEQQLLALTASMRDAPVAELEA